MLWRQAPSHDVRSRIIGKGLAREAAKIKATPAALRGDLVPLAIEDRAMPFRTPALRPLPRFDDHHVRCGAGSVVRRSARRAHDHCTLSQIRRRPRRRGRTPELVRRVDDLLEDARPLPAAWASSNRRRPQHRRRYEMRASTACPARAACSQPAPHRRKQPRSSSVPRPARSSARPRARRRRSAPSGGARPACRRRRSAK